MISKQLFNTIYRLHKQLLKRKRLLCKKFQPAMTLGPPLDITSRSCSIVKIRQNSTLSWLAYLAPLAAFQGFLFRAASWKAGDLVAHGRWLIRRFPLLSVVLLCIVQKTYPIFMWFALSSSSTPTSSSLMKAFHERVKGLLVMMTFNSDCLFSFVSAFSRIPRYRAPLIATLGRAWSAVLRPPDRFPVKLMQERDT